MDQLADHATRLLSRLIAHNTVNPPGNERALQEELAADLKDAGFEVTLVGRTEERRQERALIEDYRASLDELLAGLSLDAPELRAERYRLALEVARIPDQIKGFGHVKARNLKAARLAWDGALLRFRNLQAQQKAA